MFSLSQTTQKFLLSLVLATLIVLSVVSSFNTATVLVIIVLTMLFYIIMLNINGVNYGALPDTTFPNPPHLGLDGISIENRASIFI